MTRALFLCLFAMPATLFAATDIEFILDVSGSMKQETQGESQIVSARNALKGALNELPAGAHAALRAYGHRVEQSKKDESCQDSELVVPFGADSGPKIASTADLLQPKGYTPIAYSLERSRDDFRSEREAEKVIILLSDGEETCGGDPVAVLNKLKADGFKVKVLTVGFNVDAKARKQLEEIAAAGNGTYYDAKNSSELNKALSEATKAAAVVEKEKAVYGKELRGGDSYESAVELPVGVEVRLDHHQKKNDYDYFYVDLKKGQEVNLELHTFEKGVSIRDDMAKEEDVPPYAGLSVSDSNRNSIKSINIIGEKHRAMTESISINQPGRYYILVGSSYETMNKNHTSFKVTTISRGDLGTEMDAGESDVDALEVEPKRYTTSYLGGADNMDLFAFEAKQGESFFVGVIPTGQFSSWFKVKVLDEYKQIIVEGGSKIGAGVKTDQFTISSNGKYFIEISLGSEVDKTISYTLDLKKLSGESQG